MKSRALALALFFSSGVGLVHGESPATRAVPWPRGAAPSEQWLSEQLAEAVKLDETEHVEETRAAAEVGEASEDIRIRQELIDQKVYSHDRLFQLGDSFFDHAFGADDGYGPGEGKGKIHRVHRGIRGGLDGHSCSACHAVGGPDGAGSEPENAYLEGDGSRISTALIRNAPSVLGAGYIQSIAHEMSIELGALREAASERSKKTGAAVTVKLESHGVSFGSLQVAADGRVDTTKLEGIDADLVVKPFGWKGTMSSLRRFVEDASRLHFGVQSEVLLAAQKERPNAELVGGSAKWFDRDNDGMARELLEGALTTSAVYLAMLESPVMIPPNSEALRDRWAHGMRLFSDIGCANCHRTSLPLMNPFWEEKSDTTGSVVRVQLHLDGDKPKAGPEVRLFSDFKRHDMGPELADAHENSSGVKPSVWLTRPLWGLAETAPYLHDGRAATIPEAILAHGGEANEVRATYARLGQRERADVTIFLLSLSREPRLRVAR
jgi:Di-haem oxidoreductase, putative peroxidase